MLTAIPPARVMHEWDRIAALTKMRLDPGRSLMDIAGEALSGDLQFWRVEGPAKGYVATQITRERGSLRRTYWVIYAGGSGGGVEGLRATMAEIEAAARKQKCFDMRFQGRDWRKVYPDFTATKDAEGRWHFRKVL